MKKLIAVLLTLLISVSVLSLCVAADTTEAVTAPVVTEPTTEAPTAPSTAPSTEDDTFLCTCPNCVTEPEEETTGEEGPKTTFGFFPSTLLTTLPVMGMGMLGIFLVTLVIVLATVLLSKLGNIKKKKEEE